jgi:hypothetical protein
MTESPTSNDGVQFPVYVVEKISGDVDVYSSYKVMQSFLEVADVEKSRYEAYDWEGFALRLGVDGQRSSWLRLSRAENQLSVPDFWELKFNAVAHEEESQPLFEQLKTRLGLTKS